MSGKRKLKSHGDIFINTLKLLELGRLTIPNICEVEEQLELTYTAGGEDVKWYR